MGFADEIYEMYKERLSGKDEDAIAIVLGLLNDFSHEEILEKIKEMEDHEIYQMFTIYLIEALKMRMAEEDTVSSLSNKDNNDTVYH